MAKRGRMTRRRKSQKKSRRGTRKQQKGGGRRRCSTADDCLSPTEQYCSNGYCYNYN